MIWIIVLSPLDINGARSFAIGFGRRDMKWCAELVGAQRVACCERCQGFRQPRALDAGQSDNWSAAMWKRVHRESVLDTSDCRERENLRAYIYIDIPPVLLYTHFSRPPASGRKAINSWWMAEKLNSSPMWLIKTMLNETEGCENDLLCFPQLGRQKMLLRGKPEIKWKHFVLRVVLFWTVAKYGKRLKTNTIKFSFHYLPVCRPQCAHSSVFIC